MLVKIKKYNYFTYVIQDPENKEHFYEFGENGRLISDYSIEDIEIIDEETNS